MNQISDNKSLNVLDVLKYLSRQWKWYLLSLIVFCGYYYYNYSASPFTYVKRQTVLVKTNTSNTLSVAKLTRQNYYAPTINVNAEILQLKSKTLMGMTVEKLNAHINYGIKEGLRMNELYKNSPLRVDFVNDSDNYTKFGLEIQPNGKVRFSQQTESELFEQDLELNKIQKTPAGNIIVRKSDNAGTINKFINKKIIVEKLPLDVAVNKYLANLQVEQMEDVAMLDMNLKDQSPDRAADILIGLVQMYNDESIRDKNKIAEVTADFIRERIKIIEQDLGSIEGSIENIKTSNLGLDVKEAGQQYWSETREYKSSSKDLEISKKLVEDMRQRFIASNKDELIPSNTGLLDQTIEAQIAEYNSLLLKRNRLMEGSSSNPVVEELNTTLRIMHEGILKAFDNVIMGYNIKIANLKREENEAINRARSLPSKQRMMLSAERQQKVKEELYILLLNRREENAISQAMEDDNIRFIDAAYGPNVPVSPTKLTKVALGLGLGLIIPTIIFLLDLIFNNKIYSRRDVENSTSVPVIAEIPLSKSVKSASRGIIVSEQGVDEISEAFRIFRTNLGFLSAGERDAKVITFSSFYVGAGKTFSILNLGVSLSFLKKKVILIDLDLRKGTLTNRTNVPMPTGMTHYLADSKITADQIIYKDRLGFPGLDIIPVGIIAPNPVELLLSKRLDSLIEQLREQYDYILIDSVPLGIVADGSIVNRVSDVSVFVIRSGVMDKRELATIQKVHDEKTLTNMNLIINGVNFKKLKYGYGYSYGYGYGYGYGEHLDNKSIWKKLKAFFQKA